MCYSFNAFAILLFIAFNKTFMYALQIFIFIDMNQFIKKNR